MLQVLVDADNVPLARLLPLLDRLLVARYEVRLVASGRPAALAGVAWPEHAEIVPSAGWQRADVTLATAYRPDQGPLVLVSGDGDFAHLARRHPGPVLVVSSAAAGGLRDAATVIDPVHDGPDAVRRWLEAVLPGGDVR